MLFGALITVCPGQTEKMGDIELKLKQKAEELSKNCMIIDTHLDVPYRLKKKMEDISIRTSGGDFDYPRAMEGGLNAVFMAAYVPADYEEDGGAYAYTSTKVMGNAIIVCTGPYDIPNVKIDAYCVYTNNIPGGAFRGFGGPQGAFAAEGQVDKLAEALSLDPVEFRQRNLFSDGDLLSVGTPSCALRANIQRDVSATFSRPNDHGSATTGCSELRTARLPTQLSPITSRNLLWHNANRTPIDMAYL